MLSLVRAITRLPAALSLLSPWESCALKIIQNERPLTVSFICNSSFECPDSNFYSAVNIPSKTIFGVKIRDLPDFVADDLAIVALPDDQLIWFNETIGKYRLGGKNRFKIMMLMDLVEDSVDLMEELFRLMWRTGVMRSGVILKNESTALVYTYAPFRPDGNCEDTKPVYLGQCSTAYKTVFDVTKKVISLQSTNMIVFKWTRKISGCFTRFSQ